jgi:SecD/SecF fusion protein
MVDNLGRKVTLILSLLVLAIVALRIGGFRLGLDLEGGTRLVYSVDFEQAAADGLIQERELQDKDRLFNEMREIWQQRLDPRGVREIPIRREGENRIVIELPGSAAQMSKEVNGSLGADLDLAGIILRLAGESAEWEEFPTSGGELQIGAERVRYSKRVANQLIGLERNYGNEGVPSAHKSGDSVSLVANDPWRRLIEDVGSMAFFIEASRDTLGAVGDVASELAAAQQWKRDNPQLSITEYNAGLAREEGPRSRLRFFPMALDESSLEIAEADRLQALVVDKNPSWQFSGSQVQSVFQSQDTMGMPAVGFEMKSFAKSDFGDFTEENENRRMAIVINDEIVTFPNIDEALPGSGIIRGNFTIEEVLDLVKVLRSGSLRIRPTFEGQETVGATLGDEYVRRGFMGVGIGLGLVLLFMMAYYRRLGVVAAISLLYNLLLLAGALAFFQATLTLPGVAGIILTVGMAVDANILIYERIREEAEKGRKALQSAKDGFANALSTIVDANLTTLITGVILYKFGTGPVRGFATTLSVGILTSMFSALVVTRVLIHYQLERGLKSFSMARWVHDTKIRFMAKARTAMAISLVLVIAGVSFFTFGVDEQDKLGIDFLGGMTMSVRMEEPHQKSEVVDLVQGIGGIIGSSAEVKEILTSASGDGFTRFRITAKGRAGEGLATGGDALQKFRDQIMTALGHVLQRGPIEDLTLADRRASGVLYLERSHSSEDVAARLAEYPVALQDAIVTELPSEGDFVNRMRFEGGVSATKTLSSLQDQLLQASQGWRDSNQVPISLASPVDEVNAVGAQVVDELRDNAIFAILLSLFAAVMYIRVRFAEYSFGFAAVVALTHDVLITLGALAVADRFLPFIDTEINLPMIAAFLTIIGYSLNDTIVVFDRIRENLPRMQGSLSDIIDRSINQCLSRTLLTSMTTIISVALLLAFNLGTGNVIEGFAFALLVGVVVGTYSSMFIASPVLLWLESRRQHGLGADDPTKKGSKAVSA